MRTLAIFFLVLAFQICDSFNNPFSVTLSGSSKIRKRPHSVIIRASSSVLQRNENAVSFMTDALRRLFKTKDESLEKIRSCKSKLFSKVQLKQGRNPRREIETILEELTDLRKLTAVRDDDLVGTWKLIWSSQTADVNPLQTPSKVLGGDCYQVISKGRAENIVTWPKLNLTLTGSATSDRIGPARFSLTIDSFSLDLGALVRIPLLQLTTRAPAIVLRDAPKVREGSQLVSVGGARERVLNQRTGWLEVLYLDEEGLRVSRADTGLLYVHQRLS